MREKKDIKEIFQVAIKSVMPQNIIKNSSYLDILSERKFHLFGSGKASVEMAKTIKELVGENIIDGFIVTPYEDEDLEGVKVFKSTHPLPSKKSIEAANELLKRFSTLKEDDFFVYLLSGGSSALIELPIDALSLDDMIKTTNLLLQNSVSISEINIVRKHLSLIKGGRLAKATKAKGVVLVISDVIGDDLEAIGSAPLYCDSSTLKDAKNILKKYDIFNKVPKSVQKVLEFQNYESPKNINKNIEHKIIANNKKALESAKDFALSLGYSCDIVTDSLQGDVTIVAKQITQAILESDKEVLIFGGEPTVEVLGSGKGGRNQELCLHVLKEIKNHKNITFLSGGSDGIDGNTEVAGGIVDFKSYRDDIDDFLQNSDSYHFLKRNGDLLVTGASGTNVMDIMIAIKGVKNV